ncbi:MAG: nuclear transport factor 2 family protein [Pseudomonadota bacterium]
MEAAVRTLFERYERVFNQGLAGDLDLDEAASLYAPEFIAASPAGVMTGRNDARLRAAMAEGYARYRALGMKAMRLRDLRLSAIDGLHCLAHAAWTAAYGRPGAADVSIDFDVHYLVQRLEGQPRVFGWVSGDEEAALKAHGIA